MTTTIYTVPLYLLTFYVFHFSALLVVYFLTTTLLIVYRGFLYYYFMKLPVLAAAPDTPLIFIISFSHHFSILYFSLPAGTILLPYILLVFYINSNQYNSMFSPVSIDFCIPYIALFFNDHYLSCLFVLLVTNTRYLSTYIIYRCPFS